MNNELLVKVEYVTKKFFSRSFGNLKRSLWYGVKDIASEMIGRTVDHDELRKDQFWTADDVSLPCWQTDFEWQGKAWKKSKPNLYLHSENARPTYTVTLMRLLPKKSLVTMKLQC